MSFRYCSGDGRCLFLCADEKCSLAFAPGHWHRVPNVKCTCKLVNCSRCGKGFPEMMMDPISELCYRCLSQK